MEADMAQYVKREELAGYVLKSEIESQMSIEASRVAGEKIITAMGALGTKEEIARLTKAMVQDAWSADESKAEIVQIAQSATKELIQREVDKIHADITLLRSEVEQSRQPVKEDVKDVKPKEETEKAEKEAEKGDDEKRKDKRISELQKEIDEAKDPKRKRINELQKKINEVNEQPNKEKDKRTNESKEKKSITMRREFIYLPKYTGTHENYDDWKFNG